MHSKYTRTDGQRTTVEENGASRLHLIYIINPHLIPLRLTSQLVAWPPKQNQRFHFGTKQMALQRCTKVL